MGWDIGPGFGFVYRNSRHAESHESTAVVVKLDPTPAYTWPGDCLLLVWEAYSEGGFVCLFLAPGPAFEAVQVRSLAHLAGTGLASAARPPSARSSETQSHALHD